MKLNKTYLPLLLAVIVSVSSFKTTYHLGRTLGDYSHFAESLFSNKKEEKPNNDEYYMKHRPPAKNFINDLGIFSRDGEEGKEFKIKDLMKYVITPDNELDNLSSKGQLSFEIEHENIINELEKKKNESITQEKVSIPGTNELIKPIKHSNSINNSNLNKPAEATNNLRSNIVIGNKSKVINNVNAEKSVPKIQPSILKLKADPVKKTSQNMIPKQIEKKEMPIKKESKEELLNDIFSDMD